MVGSSYILGVTEAFIWDKDHGMRSLREILIAQGDDLAGWRLAGATGISADGRIIVGTGINPAGNTEAWLARLERAVINDLVTFAPLTSTFQTTTNPAGCPEGCVGKFSFHARLTDKTTSPDVTNVLAKVTTLSNGNLLQNADGEPTGVGATVAVPKTGAYADGVLSPGQFVDVPFHICLKQMQAFTLFVDVLGAPVAP